MDELICEICHQEIEAEAAIAIPDMFGIQYFHPHCIEEKEEQNVSIHL